MNVNELFPAKWLAPADLKGRSAVVEVERVTLEEVFNPRMRQVDKKLAVAFKGARKRMLLNKTQAYGFAAACQSADTAQWVGRRVQLSTGIAPNRAETIVVSAVPEAPVEAAEPPVTVPPTEQAAASANGKAAMTKPKSQRKPLPPDPSGMGTAHTGRYAATAVTDEDAGGPPDLPVICDEDEGAAGDD